MIKPYQVSRFNHSRIHSWQWRCLATRTGLNPSPAQCSAGGLARTEDDAERHAAEHAATHHTEEQP